MRYLLLALLLAGCNAYQGPRLKSEIIPPGGGGGGIASINGDTTSAQIITGSSGVSCSTTSGTTTCSLGSVPTSVVTGTTTNDNATAGNIGEYMSSVVQYASAITINNNAQSNIASIILTAGDWDVTAIACVQNTGSATSTSVVEACVSTSSTTCSGGSAGFGNNWILSNPGVSLVNADWCLDIPALRESLASSTTLYMNIPINGLSGGTAGYGRLTARRVR